MDEEFSPEQIASWERFLLWQKENAPRVAKMDEPITIKQFYKLLELYDRDTIVTVLAAMHNKKDLLKKYVSAYLTAKSWCARETNQPQTTLSPAAQKILNASKNKD